MIDSYITESYFAWLKSETFLLKGEQRTFEGALRVLHDIPFTWLIHADDNRSGDAVAFRQGDFLDQIQLPADVNQVALGQWATAAPSVLEVLLGCARRYAYYFDGPSVPFYFNIMFRNMNFQEFPGRSLNPIQQHAIREMVDTWLYRRFAPNGWGSPWPLTSWEATHVNQQNVDMWSQMNAYSAEHFQ